MQCFSMASPLSIDDKIYIMINCIEKAMVVLVTFFNTREEIAGRDDSLDITWLRDGSNGGHDNAAEPEELVCQAIGELEGALDDLKAILVELGAEERT
jgi:hypothetical protein